MDVATSDILGMPSLDVKMFANLVIFISKNSEKIPSNQIFLFIFWKEFTKLWNFTTKKKTLGLIIFFGNQANLNIIKKKLPKKKPELKKMLKHFEKKSFESQLSHNQICYFF